MPEAASCPTCGHPVPAGARFCRHCGSAVTATPVAERTPDRRATDESRGKPGRRALRRSVLVGVAVLVVAGGVAAGVLAATSGGGGGHHGSTGGRRQRTTRTTQTTRTSAVVTPTVTTPLTVSTTTTSPTTATPTTAGPATTDHVTAVLARYATAISDHSLSRLSGVLATSVTRRGAGFGRARCVDSDGRAAVLALYRDEFTRVTGAYAFVRLSTANVYLVNGTATVHVDYRFAHGGAGPISFTLVDTSGGWRISHISAICTP